ncbi:YuiA family protein [Salisediminibacterium selenitireducens]|uniref:Chaperone protein DnaJ n=1 Tax=Bacillus selenitireducens (strain ATCC 700615 / DSM 15326 / MLS10) TaxID=439292 RepID=D6Y191_BACIE|nr:YuiA family protein [Salisediminibacterium selenitireducens]ADH98695.1 hypothetical protein Bsel_1182 [[Bacillus] selenitireducens MLS10]
MGLHDKKLEQGECPYCEGKGYHQPPLTVTETCPDCHGTGEKRQAS